MLKFASNQVTLNWVNGRQGLQIQENPILVNIDFFQF